jgi:hypothetical protein
MTAIYLNKPSNVLDVLFLEIEEKRETELKINEVQLKEVKVILEERPSRN